MKKFAALLVITIICCNVSKAQYVNLPDTNFRNYLKQKYPLCFNAANMMDTTCSSILTEDTIDFRFQYIYNYIKNLDGIQYFKALNYLNLTSSNLQLADVPSLPANLKTFICTESYLLTTLPVLPAGLVYLDCSRGQLSSLPDLPSSLQYLYCSANPINTLPAPLPAGLKTLDCSSNNITFLPPALPDSLTTLICQGNMLTVLPVFPPTLITLNFRSNSISIIPPLPASLKLLECGNNNISMLPSLPDSLYTLYCYNNHLTSLPVLSNTLTDLNCSNNQFGNFFFNISLPDSLKFFDCTAAQVNSLPTTLPAELKTLSCGANHLTSLPSFPKKLKFLDCYSNQLTFLPELPTTLQYLDCTLNDIYCLPKLPEKPQFDQALRITFDADKIKCVPNKPQSLSLLGYISTSSEVINVFPLCNPTNNINHCVAFPVIAGTVFYDNNSNGIKDVNEPIKPNLKVILSNGNITFSDNNGHFEIGTDSVGTYTISAIAPSYFNVVPAITNYDFTTYDTLVTKQIALQANSVVNELTIRITPINWAARPGYAFPYLISYENTGTTTISPNIVFDYDQSKLNYNTSSVSGVVDNNSDLLYNTGTISPGESGSFISYFTLKTTVPLGDTINAKAIISANSFIANDSVQTIVRGAFDPNDKQATAQLSPSQVAAGKYIDYTIRFQNTGTDTAFNIVISDTLNEELQAGSLQMLASSHTCKATVKDNIVFFEFLNIQLPDSNINEAKSHGFVSFKIKPQTSVLTNTIIPNNAAIFFDYNAPVITNTAGTLIKEFTVVPLRLISFSAIPQTDNTTSLYWKTANEINTKHFVIEQGTDGTRFNAVSTVTAKGNASNNYNSNIAELNSGIIYYRLKMVDNNGNFTYSPIIKIDRRKNVAGFSILTNPVKDFIIINNTDQALNNTSCSIISSLGAAVKSFILTPGSQTIDVKGLPPGIYYLRTIKGSVRIIIH